jgi:hypothetical protein
MQSLKHQLFKVVSNCSSVRRRRVTLTGQMIQGRSHIDVIWDVVLRLRDNLFFFSICSVAKSLS